MREKLLNFIKDKFNIALIIIQVLAIVFYALTGVSVICIVLFFALEGAFFIVWGAKIFHTISKSKASLEVYQQLPYTEQQKIALIKKHESVVKNNKFIAIVLIAIGAILIFNVFSLIF